MLTQRPILLEDTLKAISRFISRFRRQTESPEQTAIVTDHAETVRGKIDNSNELVKLIGEIIGRLNSWKAQIWL